MGMRLNHLRNGSFAVVFLFLVAAGVAFMIEKQQVQNGAEAIGHIIAKRRIPHMVGPTSDPYEIIIEYQVNGQRKRIVTPRAVWDSWGTLNNIGATVPVWYLPDGRAFIDHFNYLYPFTTTLLVFAAMGLMASLYLFFIARSRLEKVLSRTGQYQRTRKIPHRRLSQNRKHLLGRIHRLLVLLGLVLLLAVIGVLRESAWLYLIAIAGVLVWLVAMKKALVCPHCGASLTKDLKELDPLLGRTNWLIVRDNLAKGVAIICSHCGRSLDDRS